MNETQDHKVGDDLETSSPGLLTEMPRTHWTQRIAAVI
jgi:hypothetical protein